MVVSEEGDGWYTLGGERLMCRLGWRSSIISNASGIKVERGVELLGALNETRN